MQNVKGTIKNAESYSSGDALKLFSQCAEIQLTLRANFMTSLSSHFCDNNVASPQGLKCQSLSHILNVFHIRLTERTWF